MPASSALNWRAEFGLDGAAPPEFFSNKFDIDAAGNAASQAHVLQRAFDELELDGVLCHDNAPLIYFRQVDRIDPGQVAALHRTFWNQGVAPILVLIAPDEVHVYSGLSEPTVTTTTQVVPAGFVHRLDRVAEQLQAFLLSVESREYFHKYRPAFDPDKRVDRNLLRNLEATRSVLGQVPAAGLKPETLDALLCRLVFTCYLFDRKIIDRKYLELAGINNAEHLRDILGRNKPSVAKADLYKLFTQLGHDFNGDLFSDDLEAEARQVRVEHLAILDHFFRGTDVRTGQQVLWPYEFGIIPIETISAIYEHFLKAAGEAEKKKAGAFYTPRFLAELVLDRALAKVPTLLGKRFLDPACGSGIFLVGLFNRIAEEWNRNNSDADYSSKLDGLTSILKTAIYGIDKNPTACRITAFSLYLAFLDQLSPPSIRRVLKKVKVLPRLLADEGTAGTIRCADFFTAAAELPEKVDVVVGNPPWAKAGGRTDPPAVWCAGRGLPLPENNIAGGFVWKAADCLTECGRVYFLLPHLLLFKTGSVDFQLLWFQSHGVDLILNLADYQRYLFEHAEEPAILVGFSKSKPANSAHPIDYWSPKTDWAVTQAEVITVLPRDRTRLTVREVLNDLRSDDAPYIWKERYWATFRDRRLMDRLRLYPRLRSLAGTREDEPRRWLVSEGFKPFVGKAQRKDLHTLRLKKAAKIGAGTHELSLFLTDDQCKVERELVIEMRSGVSNLAVFKGPLVLTKRGYSTDPEIAFTYLNVAYQDGVRGIKGPPEDIDLLAFLTFYLRSKLAQYFLFHSSSSWGVYKARVEIGDLKRLPFPLPEATHNPARAAGIVAEIGRIMFQAIHDAAGNPFEREGVIRKAQAQAETFIEEYFDIDGIERMLVSDTVNVVIRSARPGRNRDDVHTIMPATQAEQAAYTEVLCDNLNHWARDGYRVHGKAVIDGRLGIGMVVLEKTERDRPPTHLDTATKDVLLTLTRLQRVARIEGGPLALARGLKVFDRTLLYITKPVGLRFWTRTAALNDADEIAGSLLMQSRKEAT